MLADRGQELGMNEKTRDGKKIIQGPEVIMASEEIYKLAMKQLIYLLIKLLKQLKH